ncbi:hypothetical protein HK102_007342, partial [Quaeritorhiza haematococci]
MSVGARAVLGRDPQIAPKTQALIDALLVANAPPTSIDVTNIVFGPNAQTPIITFSKIVVSISTSQISQIASKTFDSVQESLLSTPGLVRVTGADVELAGSTRLNVGVQANVDNRTPVAVSVGAVGVDVLVDEGRVAGVGVQPIALGRGNVPVNLGVEASLATGANGMAAKVATIVSEILANKPPSPALAITNFRLTPRSASANPAATIDQFVSLKIPIPASLISKINPLASLSTSSPSSSASPIDISALLPSSPSALMKQLNPAVRSAVVETLPGAKVSLGAALGYTNPLPISAKVPFVKVQLNVDGVGIVVLDISGLTLVRNAGDMSPTIVTTFYNEPTDAVPNAVAKLVDDFLNQNALSQAFSVQSIYFGMSATDVNDLLSGVNADVSAIVRGVRPSEITEIAMSTVPVPLPLTWDYIQQQFAPSVGTVSAATAPGKTLSVQADAGFLFPFPITLRVGYIASRIGLNNAPLVEFAVPGVSVVPTTNGASRNTLNINTNLKFIETDATPPQVARLASAVLAGADKLDTTVDLANVYVGVSESDRIIAFSRVQVPVALDSVVRLGWGPIDLAGMAGKFVSDAINGNGNNGNGSSSFALQNANFAVAPGKRLNAGVSATVGQLPLPFNVVLSVGYAQIGNVMLDEVPAVAANVRGGISYNTAKVLAVPDVVVGIQDTQQLAEKIRSIFDGYLQTGSVPGSTSVTGLEFGHGAGDTITAFSQVSVSMALNPVASPLASYASQFVNDVLNSIPRNLLSGVLGRNETTGGITIPLARGLSVSLNHADIKFQPQSTIDAGIAAGLVFPFRISASVPFMGVEVALDETPAMRTEVSGLNIAGAGTNALSLGSRVVVRDSDPLADKIATIANAFFESKPFPGTLRFSGAVLGTSPSDTINALSLVNVPLNLNRLLEPVTSGLNRTVDPLALLTQFGFNLNNVAIKTAPERSILAQIGASFNLPFPISLQMGYAATSAGLDTIDVVDAHLGGISLVAGANTLTSLTTRLAFPSSPQIQDRVASFVSEFLSKGLGNTGGFFAASNLRFGYSATDYIRCLSKARLGIPTSAVLNNKTVSTLLGQIG